MTLAVGTEGAIGKGTKADAVAVVLVDDSSTAGAKGGATACKGWFDLNAKDKKVYGQAAGWAAPAKAAGANAMGMTFAAAALAVAATQF